MSSEQRRPPQAVSAETPDVQARINAYWDRRGTTYDTQPRHGFSSDAERAAWLAALRDFVPESLVDVLDVGTGTGFLALLLAAQGHHVIGIDLSTGMLDVARDKARALPDTARPEFRIGDAMNPLLPPGSVDAIVSRHVLWTLTDPAHAFRIWWHLLRPGGRLVVIDGLWWAGERPPAPAPPTTSATSWQAIFQQHYADPVRARLPLMGAESFAPIVAAIEAAGFTAVRLPRLEEIERIEREINPESGETARYIIVAERQG